MLLCVLCCKMGFGYVLFVILWEALNVRKSEAELAYFGCVMGHFPVE